MGTAKSSERYCVLVSDVPRLARLRSASTDSVSAGTAAAVVVALVRPRRSSETARDTALAAAAPPHCAACSGASTAKVWCSLLSVSQSLTREYTSELSVDAAAAGDDDGDAAVALGRASRPMSPERSVDVMLPTVPSSTSDDRSLRSRSAAERRDMARQGAPVLRPPEKKLLERWNGVERGGGVGGACDGKAVS